MAVLLDKKRDLVGTRRGRHSHLATRDEDFLVSAGGNPDYLGLFLAPRLVGGLRNALWRRPSQYLPAKYLC